MSRQRSFSTIERCVLAELLSYHELLDGFPDLEASDFQDPRHRYVFATMRNLQVMGADRGSCGVAEHLHGATVERTEQRARGQWKDEIDFLAELTLLVRNAPRYERKYRDEHFRADVLALRSLANQRRMIEAA